MLETALRIFGIIFPVFACTSFGLLYGYLRRPDMRVVNKLTMEVFLPILIFWALLDKPFDFSGYLKLAVGAVVVILGTGLLLWPVVKGLGINLKTFVPPMMFNNSGNMGIPLVLFAFGEEFLQAAVILFIIEMLLHFTVGLYMLDRQTRFSDLLRMPMILATLFGLLGGMLEIRLPGPVMETIKLLGQVAIPLMLFSLGVRMLDVNFRDWKLGILGAILGPVVSLLCAIALLPVLQLEQIQVALLLLFAVLPPAVTNVLVAEQYQQEPARVASIVLLGNLGSLIVIPPVLWYVLT